MPDYDPTARDDDAIIEQAVRIISRRIRRELESNYLEKSKVTVMVERFDKLRNFEVELTGSDREAVLNIALSLHARERARRFGAP